MTQWIGGVCAPKEFVGGLPMSGDFTVRIQQAGDSNDVNPGGIMGRTYLLDPNANYVLTARCKNGSKPEVHLYQGVRLLATQKTDASGAAAFQVGSLAEVLGEVRVLFVQPRRKDPITLHARNLDLALTQNPAPVVNQPSPAPGHRQCQHRMLRHAPHPANPQIRQSNRRRVNANRPQQRQVQIYT